MKPWLPLALALALASPAHAGENFYRYPFHVLTAEPVTTYGPGSLEGPASRDVVFELPEFAFWQPVLKQCPGALIPLEKDEDVTFYPSGQNLREGLVGFTVGDRRRGRTQTWCVRLDYWPLERLYGGDQ